MLTVSDTAYSIAVIRAREAELVPTERRSDDPYAALSAAAGAHASKGTQRFLALPFFHDGVRNATIDRSLAFMARIGSPGNRLAFTFGSVSFDPESAATRTRRAGFCSCEELGFDDAWRRYLPGEPHPNASVVRIGVAIV